MLQNSPDGSVTLDLNMLVAVATAAGTLVALAAAWLTHRHNQRAVDATERGDVERQIAKEVEAKVGSVLISLRQLEADARTQLQDFTTSLSASRKQLTGDIEQREATFRAIVESASTQASEIENLLQRAQELLPVLEGGSVVPIQILYAARSANSPMEQTAGLVRILEHPDSDARVLELAGDLARQELENRALALRLYRRAYEVDPDSVSAKAEYLALLAYSASERASAQVQIRELALQNPNDPTVVNCLVNFHIRRSDYEGLRDVATEMLRISTHQRLLWRNIAVALYELGRPHEEIVEAYTKALEGADAGGFENAARPYSRYLIRRGDIEEAETILRRALMLSPSDGDLHRTYVDLVWTKRDYELATRHLLILGQIGDQEDKLFAARRLRDIEILRKLEWDGSERDAQSSIV